MEGMSELVELLITKLINFVISNLNEIIVGLVTTFIVWFGIKI